MTALEVAVMRRKRRRTHLIAAGATFPMCGTITALTDAALVPVPLIGGATTRLRIDLERELDGNTCMHCTRIAIGMLSLYVARDLGRRP